MNGNACWFCKTNPTVTDTACAICKTPLPANQDTQGNPQKCILTSFDSTRTGLIDVEQEKSGKQTDNEVGRVYRYRSRHRSSICIQHYSPHPCLPSLASNRLIHFTRGLVQPPEQGSQTLNDSVNLTKALPRDQVAKYLVSLPPAEIAEFLSQLHNRTLTQYDIRFACWKNGQLRADLSPPQLEFDFVQFLLDWWRETV